MSATDIDLAAADWLQKKTFWNWSDDDQKALDAWLAQSEAHQIAFWRQSAMWNRTERLVALRPMQRVERSAAPERKSTWPLLLRSVAAVGIVAVLGTFAAQYALKPKETAYSTTIGGHETLTLGDGTKVELNTDTKVRVSSDRRKVWLDRGEAYFDVVHDAAHPFIVMVGDHRVTDLGTKFLIRQNANHVEVSLFEGRAQLDTTDDWSKAHATTLLPGDVAIATADSILVMKKPEKTLSSELGWRRGVLIFRHASLAEVAAEFNRYNRRQLVIEDRAAARLTIDGTFQADNIDDFTRLAQLVLGVRVENRGSEIAIMR